MSIRSLREIYDQALYTGYAIKSVLALVQVLKDIHNETCSLQTSNFCSNFSDVIRRDKQKIISKLFEMMKKFKNSFPEPFNVTFEDPLRSLSKTMTTNETLSTLPVYEVYQFGKRLDNSEQYCLNKIGKYKDDNLYLETPLKVFPAVAECPLGKKCTDCLPKTPNDLVYFEEGDFYVVGVVPVYHKLNADPTGCDQIKKAHSVELAEVMAYAVKKYNNNTNYFPHEKVGFIILNSCNQRLVIQRKILDLLDKGMLHVNGSYINVREKIMGFIGGFSSTATIAMADILSELGYVQISYAGTSTVLTDRKKYPYFLRVVPPNSNECITIIHILNQLKESSYVQVIYSEGAFGESCNAAFKTETKKKNICIANEIAVYEDKYSGILEILRKNQYAKIVVAFLQSYMAVGVARELQLSMEHGEFMLIGSQALGQTPDIISGNDKFVGSFTLSFGMSDIPGFNNYLNNIDIDSYQKNPWFKDYMEEKYGCYMKGSFNKLSGKQCLNTLPEMTETYKQEQWTPYAYSAIVTFLQGANKTFHQLCGWNSKTLCSEFKNKPKELWNNIKDQTVNIYGINKHVSLYNSNGDGNAAYTIYNVQRNKNNPLQIDYEEVGQTSTNETDLNFKLQTDRLQYSDSLQLPSRCPNNIICTECFWHTETMQDGLSFETKCLIGGVVVLAFIIIVLISIIIFKFRGKKEDDDHYIHAQDDSEYYHTLKPPKEYKTAIKEINQDG